MQMISPNGKSEQSTETLAQAAIAAALQSSWQEAAKINEKILTQNKDDVEALNRLARAQACLGLKSKAEKTYKKVLELDPYNIIALKNMDKLSKSNGSSLSINTVHTNGTMGINISQVFLDEPGKTKLVGLLNLASPSTLASLNCGDKLTINPKNHSISVMSENGTYLGAFPDDLAHKLLAFISGGNKYEAFVKSSSTKNLTIFLREVLRAEKFGNQPSFQSKSSLFDDDSK